MGVALAAVGAGATALAWWLGFFEATPGVVAGAAPLGLLALLRKQDQLDGLLVKVTPWSPGDRLWPEEVEALGDRYDAVVQMATRIEREQLAPGGSTDLRTQLLGEIPGDPEVVDWLEEVARESRLNRAAYRAVFQAGVDPAWLAEVEATGEGDRDPFPGVGGFHDPLATDLRTYLGAFNGPVVPGAGVLAGTDCTVRTVQKGLQLTYESEDTRGTRLMTTADTCWTSPMVQVEMAWTEAKLPFEVRKLHRHQAAGHGDKPYGLYAPGGCGDVRPVKGYAAVGLPFASTTEAEAAYWRRELEDLGLSGEGWRRVGVGCALHLSIRWRDPVAAAGFARLLAEGLPPASALFAPPPPPPEPTAEERVAAARVERWGQGITDPSNAGHRELVAMEALHGAYNAASPQVQYRVQADFAGVYLAKKALELAWSGDPRRWSEGDWERTTKALDQGVLKTLVERLGGRWPF